MRKRFLDGARKLRSTGFLRRLGVSLLLAFVGGQMLVFGALRTPFAGQSLTDWAIWLGMVFFCVFMLLSAFHRFFRSDSASPVRGRLLLLERFLCPSCGASLSDLEADSEGCTACTQCSAAWKLKWTTTPSRYFSCPKCHNDLENVYVNSEGNRICGSCGHVMAGA